jgi:hypothetical protein
MAKSYMTKFVEYVKTCKDNLKQNLIDQGESASDNDTLDALVNRVANITPPPAPEELADRYVRDSVLPDLDEMFDNDPLRQINGGEYTACAYLVCLLYQYSSSTQQTISLNASASAPAKLVFGKSGRELEATSTSQFGFSVNEDELYELADGSQVYILKVYSKPDLLNNYGAIHNISNVYAIEVIEDDRKSASSPSYTYLRYWRYVPTYRTSTNISLSNYYRLTHTVIEGDINSVNVYYGPMPLYINGNYNGSSSTIYPYAESSAYPAKEIVVPAVSQNSAHYGDMMLDMSNFKVVQNNSSLYIPNSYQKICEGATGDSALTTIHIPNSVSDYRDTKDWFIGSSSRSFPNLRNLTISSGAFALDTSARTFYADKMRLLTKQSLANLVEGLGDRTGMSANTIRFTKLHQTMLTDEQIATLQDKNWTVTFV